MDENLEQRMFLLGTEHGHLPSEPEPISREFYNMGLDVRAFYDNLTFAGGMEKEVG
ncbi:hypothetical protein JXA85_00150 [Candidatus Woesearchaeota archaeon]|nr:hypothetical protein [Candidatus Woesearchaeota archaeon]